MSESVSKNLKKVIQIDENQIRAHLRELVRGSVEETLNQLLDAEADHILHRHAVSQGIGSKMEERGF